MSVKVFCGVPTILGYQNNPADSFRFSLPINVYQSNQGTDDGPRDYAEVLFIDLPLGATAFDVFGNIMAQIVTSTTNTGFPTPTKADIYGHAPVSMTQLLPDIPAFS
jgi:hypothetical protein